jgi:hypothetical protein
MAGAAQRRARHFCFREAGMIVKVGGTDVDVRIECIMSGPRFGPISNLYGWAQALMPLGIRPTLGQGALWGQVIQRCLEGFVDSTEYILTTDYDSFWDRKTVEELVAMAMAFQCDALAPLQVKREDGRPMFTLKGTLDNPPSGPTDLPMSWFAEPVQEVDSAHFGCTLISTKALKRTPKPWFQDQPNEKGEYGDGRTDADIWFWKQFRKAGNRVYVSPRVSIGHGEWVSVWPGKDLSKPVFQYVGDYTANGKPKTAWSVPQS